MTDRARLWQRVSTGGQDEASQLPDLITWCDSHGYDYEQSESYVVRGKSAYHGRHAADLERAFADMESGEYSVLVVWAADRIERRGALAALMLAERARKAGGRIEYVKDSHLNATNEMSDVMLALSATLARQESSRKSERVVAKHEALRAAGSITGRAPWGYRIVKRDGRKVLEPTEVGRAFVPAIYHWAIEGKSLRDIARMLELAGVKPAGGKRWNETYIGKRLIKNPTYYGQRPNAGQLETEALVSATMWQEANAALASRVRGGRGPDNPNRPNPKRQSTPHDKPLVAPLCGACYGQPREGCPSGRSPLYRVITRGGKAYFRCTGHGPQRESCKAPMVPVDVLEADVTSAMLDDDSKHIERVFIPGDDRSDEIARLRERGAAAMRAGDYAAAMKAMQQAEELESLPRSAPRWEERSTEQTEAAYFASLDREGQREYLSSMEVVADREGVVIVPRAWVATA